MSQARIVPLVGPLLVLYLTLEVIGSSPRVDPVAVAVCAVAIALSLLPFLVLRERADSVGTRRVSLLAVSSGLALVRFADAALPSIVLDAAATLALPAVGAITLHLAFDTPDAPAAIRRRRGWRLMSSVAGVLCAVAALLSVAPLEWVGGWVVPARWALAAPGYSLGAFAVAAALRWARRRMGSAPDALAVGAFAQLGTSTALGVTAALAALVWADVLSLDTLAARGLAVLAAVALLAGHVAMLGVRRRAHAGRVTRAVIAATLTLAAVSTVAGLLADQLPREPVPLSAAAALALILAAALHRVLSRGIGFVLAPYGGRLLNATKDALSRAVGATTLGQIAEAVLPALRRASDAPEAEPLLLLFDPPRIVRIDAASVAHSEPRETPEALGEALAARPGEVIVAAPLLEQVVRRPRLRGLVGALEAYDALCVVPLAVDLELEGALVVARGRRRGAVTLEEIDALERLGRHLSAQVSLLGAQERSRLRTRDAIVQRDRLADDLEAAQEELGRQRADASTLKAGGTTERYAEPAIAYSDAMRRLMRRIDALAPVDAAILLIGEHGCQLDRVAHRVHAASGRRDGAFVVAECAGVRPERADAALFGEGEGTRPGWFRLAEGGTLLLLDVPALSMAAQAKLAETLANRRAVRADSAASYAVDARVIATSRVPLGPLVAAGAFDSELARRLEPLVLAVPPLRERREDLPSLVLVALDRVCRAAGRGVVGIDPDALELLVEHSWPGNQQELLSVIDRAVTPATAGNVTAQDLPPLAAPVADPLEGTYLEVERRALERALARSEGNKSEAARLLDMKRTTFLDKLKRHGLHTPAPKSRSKRSKKSRAGTAA